jgi:predicted nucleic acid-binding protein
VTAFVMDASIALAAVLPDEFSREARSIFSLMREATALVPPIWDLEVSNSLIVAERRGRHDSRATDRLIRQLAALPVVERHVPASLSTLVGVARDRGLTTYDASYLLLASVEGAPLATLDERLRSAAVAAGIDLVEA